MRVAGGLARSLTRVKAPPRGKAPGTSARRAAGPTVADAGRRVGAWRVPEGATLLHRQLWSKPTPRPVGSVSFAGAADPGKAGLGGGCSAGVVPVAAWMGISGVRLGREAYLGVVACQSGFVPRPGVLLGRGLSQGREQGRLKDMPEDSSATLQKGASRPPFLSAVGLQYPCRAWWFFALFGSCAHLGGEREARRGEGPSCIA